MKFFMQSYLKAKRISLIDENLYYYRQTEKVQQFCKVRIKIILMLFIFSINSELLIEIQLYKCL